MVAVLRKYDIINLLGRRYDFRSYLEICTPSTGLTFSKIETSQFTTRHRLVYRCPIDASDGQPYTFRTTALTSSEITQTISAAQDGMARYDLVFVDPWHSLVASAEDLEGAWRLLRVDGMMVVHDCNPPNAETASPEFRVGEWCGETFRAFIDFLAFRSDAEYFTVDTDYGCGVVRKLRPGQSPPIGDPKPWLQWKSCQNDSSLHFSIFQSHRKVLLQLTDSESFLSRVRLIGDTFACER